jgi:hypothetical protein
MSDKRSAINWILHAGRLARKIRSRISDAIIVIVVGLALSSCLARVARAQSVPTFPVGQRATAPADSANDHYWQRFALGFASSILAHESAHVLSSLLMGFHPYVAFDHARPTVFSGIDSDKYRRQQFIFSAAGLTTQALINEAILDIPHAGGGPIERGILAGGVGTTLFYITIGRNGSVSDISVMARTSSLSKTQLSLIFGGFSAIQALRISRNPMYSHFFARPSAEGMEVGFAY